MKKHTLTVTKREITGKKVRKLRKQGILPANIYGKDVASVSVQVPQKDFEIVYKETGATGLIELHLENEKRPVLINNVQLDYMTQEPIHADFYQVNLKEKIKSMIPVVLVGEANAVVEKVGLLLQTLNEIEVEALPADLPEKFEVDVTSLAAINDQLTAESLKAPQGVTILTDAGQVIAKISELVAPEEPTPAAETPEGEVPAEGAEGETTEEGKSEEASKEEEKK